MSFHDNDVIPQQLFEVLTTTLWDINDLLQLPLCLK